MVIRFSVLALTGMLWLNGGAGALAQSTRPAPVPVLAAPARTVVVPPNDTVTLTPVYPVHYPVPIYITPPLYGNYVPPYYLPAAYFRAESGVRYDSQAGGQEASEGGPETRRNVPPPLTSSRSGQ